MTPTWRLVRTGPARGAWNMAVDEAILESVSAGAAPPTLRFYGWAPPCLSLGRFQPLAEADLEACRARGCDVVRRPTGGSAILHDRELTYSLAARTEDPRFGGSILASYREIAAALADGLQRAGVPVAIEPEKAWDVGDVVRSRGPQPAPCFIRPSGYELLLHGRKLVGSAQMRQANALLQHGAIPLEGDPSAIAGLLTPAAGNREAVADKLCLRATTVREAFGAGMAADAVAGTISAAIVEAMEARWGVPLDAGKLSGDELKRAAVLESGKYAHAEWTARVSGRS